MAYITNDKRVDDKLQVRRVTYHLKFIINHNWLAREPQLRIMDDIVLLCMKQFNEFW